MKIDVNFLCESSRKHVLQPVLVVPKYCRFDQKRATKTNSTFGLFIDHTFFLKHSPRAYFWLRKKTQLFLLSPSLNQYEVLASHILAGGVFMTIPSAHKKWLLNIWKSTKGNSSINWFLKPRFLGADLFDLMTFSWCISNWEWPILASIRHLARAKSLRDARCRYCLFQAHYMNTKALAKYKKMNFHSL